MSGLLYPVHPSHHENVRGPISWFPNNLLECIWTIHVMEYLHLFCEVHNVLRLFPVRIMFHFFCYTVFLFGAFVTLLLDLQKNNENKQKKQNFLHNKWLKYEENFIIRHGFIWWRELPLWATSHYFVTHHEIWGVSCQVVRILFLTNGQQAAGYLFSTPHVMPLLEEHPDCAAGKSHTS